MSGLLIAIIATLFWSATNLIDKYLIDRFAKESSVNALLLLSGFFPIVLLPLAYFMGEGVHALEPIQIYTLIFSGTLIIGWMYLYLNALQDEDVSVVISVLHTTPVFALIFAFVLLQELPSVSQMVYGSIILFGSLVLSVEYATGVFKTRLMFLLLVAAALVALTNTLFKLVAIDAPFWTAIFWQGVGTVSITLLLYAFNKSCRHAFNSFIKANWGTGISLNATSETSTLIGNILFAYAILLAPLAVIQTTEAYQPIFVFIGSVCLTLFVPGLMREDLSKGVLVQKLLGIAIVVIGSVLLMQT